MLSHPGLVMENGTRPAGFDGGESIYGASISDDSVDSLIRECNLFRVRSESG